MARTAQLLRLLDAGVTHSQPGLAAYTGEQATDGHNNGEDVLADLSFTLGTLATSQGLEGAGLVQNMLDSCVAFSAGSRHQVVRCGFGWATAHPTPATLQVCSLASVLLQLRERPVYFRVLFMTLIDCRVHLFVNLAVDVFHGFVCRVSRRPPRDGVTDTCSPNKLRVPAFRRCSGCTRMASASLPMFPSWLESFVPTTGFCCTPCSRRVCPQMRSIPDVVRLLAVTERPQRPIFQEGKTYTKVKCHAFNVNCIPGGVTHLRRVQETRCCMWQRATWRMQHSYHCCAMASTPPSATHLARHPCMCWQKAEGQTVHCWHPHP